MSPRRPAPSVAFWKLKRFPWFLPLGLVACGTSPGDGLGLPCGDGTQVDCGECTDVRSDLLHCGSCGNSCSLGQDCVGSACVCVSGLTECAAGSCTHLLEDPQNCGACGQSCAADQVCSRGVCAAACDVGLAQCGQSCVDVTASPFHCGGCNQACEAGKVCTGSACACAQGREDCGAGCVDILADPQNCGACGQLCGVGQACTAGVCHGPSAGVGGSASGGAGTGGAGLGGTGGAASGGADAGGGTNSGGAASGGEASGGAAAGGPGTGGAGTGGTSSGCGASGFHVSEGRLLDVNCEEFVLRGVNYPYTWFSSRDLQADLGAIAATGANAVRIVLSTGGRWTRTPDTTLSGIIDTAKANQLVSVVEVHDTTGFAEQAGSVGLSSATDYWMSADVQAALLGQEAYVIVNIANEPNGNDTTQNWVPSHSTAVQALRSAGYGHTLMVDAPNWGQDWEESMKNGGGVSIWEADPDKNVVFSVHMYDEYGTSQEVTSYFNTFLANYAAPLVVGEFAADHGAGKEVDEDTIMALADSLGIGYLGWSWSGNGDGLGSLDITSNFDPNSLTTWGTRLISGQNGIGATSELCSCFD